jgi:DNA-binding protein H-NS
VDERKRDSIVAYLRRRMDEFGITVDDLAALMAADTPAAARYRNAHGDTWDGNGEMPEWLKRAIGAGQSLKHFEAISEETKSIPTAPRVDWKNDPFAGSPLARIENRAQVSYVTNVCSFLFR